MTTIVKVIGREVMDSRGKPTVEADVVLESGALGPAHHPVPRPVHVKHWNYETRMRAAFSVRVC